MRQTKGKSARREPRRAVHASVESVPPSKIAHLNLCDWCPGNETCRKVRDALAENGSVQ
jgi:hypothetical protein